MYGIVSAEFSAALRLPANVAARDRAAWVDTIMALLELQPLANTMVGEAASGGMSFAQKKRVSIAVELAANPAILFLDEPTTGLDSRAAQVRYLYLTYLCLAFMLVTQLGDFLSFTYLSRISELYPRLTGLSHSLYE